MHQKFPVCTLVLILSVNLAITQKFEVISSIAGAASYAIASKGTLLYSGEGNTLSIYDADPQIAPPYPRLYRQRYRSFIDDLIVADNTLWICANADGLYKYELTVPEAPVMRAHWLPSSFDEAVYDVAVWGDTLFVANKKKLTVLVETDSGMEYLQDIYVLQNDASRIRGCAVGDSILAFTVATMSLISGPDDGVHLYHAGTLEPLSTIHERYGDHEEIIFSPTMPVMHVLAGGQFTSSLPFPFSDPRGLYYVVNISDPVNPAVIFRDTVAGVTGIGESQVIDGQLRNDTMYLATRTGDDQIFPLDGNVFVYDCTDAENIERIADIGVGLLHFDLTLIGQTMHVASEWFGVRSVDITDLSSPITLGDTPTGGWNNATDIHGHMMVQANEGYGLQLFDISDPASPQLAGIHINIDNGFCYNARFSQDGNHVFGCYIEALGFDEFRVFEVPSMEQIGSLDFYVGYDHCRVFGDVFVAYATRLAGEDYISFTDVSDSTQPELIGTIIRDVNELEIDTSGHVYVATNDALEVYDVHSMEMITSIDAQGDPFVHVAVRDDEVLVYREMAGVAFFDWNAGQDTLVSSHMAGVLPLGAPTEMDFDNRAVFAGYTEFGLFAYSRENLEEQAYYRTGLDFIFPYWWELEDLQVFGDLIAITEYFGQTTLLTLSDTSSATVETYSLPSIQVYPNPTSGTLTISSGANPFCCRGQLQMYTLKGDLIYKAAVENCALTFDPDVESGIYLVVLKNACGEIQTEKVVVIR